MSEYLGKTSLRIAFALGLSMFFAMAVQADEYEIYLLGGQSNGDGRGLNTGLPSSLQSTQTDVRIYYDDLFDGTPHNPKWQDLRPGLSGGYLSSSSGGTDKFGPEVSFGRAMADARPTQNIAIIKYSPGSTDLYSDWKATDPTGPMYQNFLGHVNDALDDLTNNGHTYTVSGMLWMQGENDTATSAMANSYEANLTNFVNNVRTDLGVANMRLVIGQINATKDRSGYYSPPSEDGGQVIQQAQANVSQSVSNAPLVVTQDLGLQADLTHYTASGQRALGERFANRVLVDATSSGSTVGYWRFERSQGYASDVGGNCLTLTRGDGNNTITDEPTEATLPGSGAGAHFGDPIPQTGASNAYAASFDGSNHFRHADDGRFAVSDFTIEAYVRKAGTATQAIASQYYNSGDADERSWMLFVRNETGYGDENRKLELALSDDGTSASTITINSGLDIMTGTDYFIAVSFDESNQAGGVTFYVKNLETDTWQTATLGHGIDSLHDSAGNFNIGAASNDTIGWDGLIDEVRLSNVVLGQDDMLASIPEPATMALLILGLPFVLRRRKEVERK